MQFGRALLAMLPLPLDVPVGASSGELADTPEYTVCTAIEFVVVVVAAEETGVVTSWLQLEASALLCRPLESGAMPSCWIAS